MANKTRELILDAFITLARRNPQRTSFTMTEIAAEAGISRQAIYQKHFNNFEDIIDYIHKETDQQIFNNFNNYCPERDGDPITFLADHILPLIYEKREVVGTLYTTQVDPCWKEFLRGTYSEWVLKNVNYQLNIILVKKTSLISLRPWRFHSLKCGFVKIIQYHLKSIERLSFNCLRLLFVTILCPKKRILSSTQDSFYCPPLKASTIT